MLNRRSQNILWAIGLAIVSVIVLELVRPQPLNWRPSYTSGDKIPFGCFILYQELPNLMGVPVESISKDPYEFFADRELETNTAYLLINENYYFDANQVEAMKNYVANGNTVFLSALQFGYILNDSLGIEAYSDYVFPENTLVPKFYNQDLNKNTKTNFKKRVYKSYFDSVDTLKTEALGYFEPDDSDDEPTLNLIRLRHGNGEFIMHTLPHAFTNYYLLQSDPDYAAKVLSFVKAEKVYWDSYLKYGKKVVASPIQFVLTNPPLKWAYYLSILGLIAFVLFVAKREQRLIEVIHPLENSSVEFTRTVGNLYLQHGDFTDIITKKINYFMAHIRSHYYINTNEPKKEFIQRLALKTNHTVEQTEKLIQFIDHLKSKSVHTEQDLIALNKKMEAFKI